MAKKKKDQDQVKKNRGKGEQPPVTPNTAPEGVQPPEAATPKVNDEEMVAGLRHAFENGQLTFGQLVQAYEAGGAVADTALEILGMLVSRHNNSIQERLDLEMRPTPTPPPEPPMGLKVDLNAIREESRVPIGVIKIVITPEGGIEVTVPDPAGRSDARQREVDGRNGNLLAIAQLIATL